MYEQCIWCSRKPIQVESAKLVLFNFISFPSTIVVVVSFGCSERFRTVNSVIRLHIFHKLFINVDEPAFDRSGHRAHSHTPSSISTFSNLMSLRTSCRFAENILMQSKYGQSSVATQTTVGNFYRSLDSAGRIWHKMVNHHIHTNVYSAWKLITVTPKPIRRMTKMIFIIFAVHVTLESLNIYANERARQFQRCMQIERARIWQECAVTCFRSCWNVKQMQIYSTDLVHPFLRRSPDLAECHRSVFFWWYVRKKRDLTQRKWRSLVRN